MYEEFMKLRKWRKDWDQDELVKIINACLEDMNYYTFKYLFIAYLYGTYEEVEKASRS